MADTSIRGVVVVWDSEDAPKPAKPVRNLEDELVGPLVIDARRKPAKVEHFECVHCGLGTHSKTRACGRPSCIRGRR